MLSQEVARRYARALFDSAREHNLLVEADEQFLALKAVLDKDRSLIDFVSAPQVPDERKIALIRDIFGKRMDRLFVEFLLVLLEKHRFIFLPDIVDEFDRLVKAEQGIVKVAVTTAVPLTASEEKALSARLASKTGMKIELAKRVDPAIIGGVIIIMHDQIIDGSIRHGLNLIEDQLEKVKVA